MLIESNLKDYKKSYNIFDVNNPPENPNEYLKIRKSLIKKCVDFTGHINDSCYLDISSNEFLDKSTLLLSRNAIETMEYLTEIITLCEKTEKKTNQIIDKQNNEIKNLKQELEKQKKIIEQQKAEINSSSMKKVKKGLSNIIRKK